MTHFRMIMPFFHQTFSGKSNGEDGRYWPKHVVFFLLLNTTINPYYHSCGIMTDIYLTISLLYTQRAWHTSEWSTLLFLAWSRTQIAWLSLPQPNSYTDWTIGTVLSCCKRNLQTLYYTLGFCDRASWANCEVREKTDKMQQLDVYF